MKIRCNYCGVEHWTPTFYLKLLSIFKTDYSFICQKCLSYNNRRLMFRTVHDVTKDERLYNKMLEANR